MVRTDPSSTIRERAAMKNLHAIATFMLLVAGTANAGQTGIINQAGPYEAQMRFYLHPAHGFPGTPPEAAAQSASAVDSKGSAGGAVTDARHAASESKPALRTSHPANHRSNRAAAAERG